MLAWAAGRDIPEHRRKFLADPETAYDDAGLTEKECTMVRNRDWREMIRAFCG
jgi:gallate dioxygenase